MKFVSFKKYKSYLESLGYTQERGENISTGLGFKTVLFSRPCDKDKIMANVFLSSDHIFSISKGYGSIYLGWNNVKIDMRKKFWKNLMSE